MTEHDTEHATQPGRTSVLSAVAGRPLLVGGLTTLVTLVVTGLVTILVG